MRFISSNLRKASAAKPDSTLWNGHASASSKSSWSCVEMAGGLLAGAASASGPRKKASSSSPRTASRHCIISGKAPAFRLGSGGKAMRLWMPSSSSRLCCRWRSSGALGATIASGPSGLFAASAMRSWMLFTTARGLYSTSSACTAS